MGGNALVPGNATPTAEANIRNDPEAADIVFGARWPVTMVGLDVTHRVLLRGPDIDRLTATPTSAGRHLAHALPRYRSFSARTNGLDGIYVHDPTAMAYLLDPSLFTVSRWPVRVETQGISRGKTWPSLGGTDSDTATDGTATEPEPWRGRPAVGVCVDVESQGVIDLILRRLSPAGPARP